MTTAFNTGPGFYAASSAKVDDCVPPGKIRLFVARIEAYDGPLKMGTSFDQTSFKLLVAMTEGRPDVARALLQLHDSLGSNLEYLKREAKQ